MRSDSLLRLMPLAQPSPRTVERREKPALPPRRIAVGRLFLENCCVEFDVVLQGARRQRSAGFAVAHAASRRARKLRLARSLVCGEGPVGRAANHCSTSATRQARLFGPSKKPGGKLSYSCILRSCGQLLTTPRRRKSLRSSRDKFGLRC
jgi:hypothetical protein